MTTEARKRWLPIIGDGLLSNVTSCPKYKIKLVLRFFYVFAVPNFGTLSFAQQVIINCIAVLRLKDSILPLLKT